MIILGIDPGVHRMGYGLVSYEHGKCSVLDHGLITTDKGVEHADRLASLRADLLDIISRHKPDCVAIEKLFFSTNIKTAMKVGEARGVVMLTAAEYGAPIVELAPNEVKLAVAGYGKADKIQVQKMIKTLLNLKETPKPDDVADALAIAYTAYFYRKSSNYEKNS